MFQHLARIHPSISSQFLSTSRVHLHLGMDNLSRSTRNVLPCIQSGTVRRRDVERPAIILTKMKDALSIGSSVKDLTWMRTPFREFPVRVFRQPIDLPCTGRITGLALMDGGSDTSSSVLLTFILALASNPECQQRAFEEVRSVVGARMPGICDMEKMPFVAALIKEILRLRPPVSLGLPHAASEDIYVSGKTPRFSRPDSVWLVRRIPHSEGRYSDHQHLSVCIFHWAVHLLTSL